MTSIKAEYIDHMGDDLDVVNSARVSFDKESEWEYKGERIDGVEVDPSDIGLHARDARLIKYLSDHGHFTPFTHQVIKMRETVPIAMARQRFKHTVGFTYNEISRRYVSSSPDYFLPECFRRSPGASVKQGSGEEHPHSTHWLEQLERYNNLCVSIYEEMVADGVAPEEARLVLPQGVMTSYIVTGSLAAWARAFNLRRHVNAQKMFWVPMAEQWDSIIRPLFPVSWAALVGE